MKVKTIKDYLQLSQDLNLISTTQVNQQFLIRYKPLVTKHTIL